MSSSLLFQQLPSISPTVSHPCSSSLSFPSPYLPIFPSHFCSSFSPFTCWAKHYIYKHLSRLYLEEYTLANQCFLYQLTIWDLAMTSRCFDSRPRVHLDCHCDVCCHLTNKLYQCNIWCWPNGMHTCCHLVLAQ